MAKTKTKQLDEAEELATALGLLCKEVRVRGELVRVEEFELEQIPQVLAAFRDLMQKGATDVNASMLARSGEVGIQLLMLATGKPREWFRSPKIPLGDGLAMYAALIEVNKSFFDQAENFTSLVEFLGGMFIPATNGRVSLDSLPGMDTQSKPLEG
jgi:hypothetical protein